MKDLTVLYISASEMPESWMNFQIKHFLNAVGDYPVISITRKPLNLGTNVEDDGQRGIWNIYMQMLRGAQLAKTPFVAMAEDDVLYTKAHFEEFRPPKDKVAYDRSRWSLFVWEKNPVYCVRQRISNCSLVAPRDLLIEALIERKNKWPDGPPVHLIGEVGRAKVDRRMGVSVVGCVEWYSYGPIVQLNHPTGSDDTQRTQWKRHGQIRAYDIPQWGRAADIAKVYYGK